MDSATYENCTNAKKEVTNSDQLSICTPIGSIDKASSKILKRSNPNAIPPPKRVCDTESKTNKVCYLDKLPDEVKQMIVDRMDIITRFRFKSCSTTTKSAVDSAPLHLKNVEATTKFDDGVWTHTLILDQFKLQEKKGRPSSEEDEDDTDDDEDDDLPSENMVSILKSVIFTGKVKIEKLQTNWVFPLEFLAVPQYLKVKNIQLKYRDVEFIKKILHYLNNGLRSAVLLSDDFGQHDVNITIQNLPIIRNVAELHVSRHINISDEFLLNCKATRITADDSFYETRTINSILKKWVEEDYPVGSTFNTNVKLENQGETDIAESEILNGLVYTQRTRTFDNKREIKIDMGNKGKYIELSHLHFNRLVHSLIVRVIIRRKPQNVINAAKNWNDLSLAIKQLVVQKMDIFTRFRLRVCSKSDKQLVESTPIHFSLLRMDNGERNSRGCFGYKFDDQLAVDVDYEDDSHVLVFDKRAINMNRWCRAMRNIKFTSGFESYRFVEQSLRSIATCNIHVDRIELSAHFEQLELLPLMTNAKEIYVTEADYFYEDLHGLPHPHLFLADYCPLDWLQLEMECWVDDDAQIDSYFKTYLNKYPNLEELFGTTMRWEVIGENDSGKPCKFRVEMGNPEKSIECTITMGKKDGQLEHIINCEVVPRNQYAE